MPWNEALAGFLRRIPTWIRSRLRNPLLLALIFVVLVIGVVRILWAAFPVDIDRNANYESTVDITSGSSTSPPSIRNIVTNKLTSGGPYSFIWSTAGPGGFAGAAGLASVTTPAATSVWEWQTNFTVSSIGCSTTNKVPPAIPIPTSSDPCIIFGTPGLTNIPQRVPGRAISSSGVTSTTESITTTYLQAFSPLQPIFQLVSEVKELSNGQFQYQTSIRNLSGFSISFDLAAGPLGCDAVVCDPPLVNCGGSCVDLNNDPQNCGSCGFPCPSGICIGGVCEIITAATTAGESASLVIPEQTEIGPCEFPTEEQGPILFRPSLSPEAVTTSGDGLPVLLGPHETRTVDCSVNNSPAKEVTSRLAAACGGGGAVPCTLGDLGVHGMANVLVPDTNVIIGDAFLSALKVELRDASGDGQLQSGETANLFVSLGNAASKGLAGLQAVLAADVIDLDGLSGEPGSDSDPDPIFVTQGTSGYPDIPGAAITGGGSLTCDTAGDPLDPAPFKNTTAFSIRVPPDHPFTTTHPFTLSLTGHLDGESAPFNVTPVRFTLGVGALCDGQSVGGSFDTLRGFLTPMAALVPKGDTPPLPPKSFNQGSAIPLKLQLACGATLLTPGNAVPPRLMALRSDSGPVDLTLIDSDAGMANQNGLPFRYDSNLSRWVYNLSSKSLGPNSYLVTVQMPDGREFDGAFILR